MIPIILGIETSTDACSVAISTPNGILQEFVVAPQAHSRLLLDMVEKLCIQAGTELAAVQAFAFGSGPGSFTGLRIAASVVQGLAFGNGKPVVAVSSLHALAQQAYNQLSIPNILAILDARMHEIYWGGYQVKDQTLVQNILPDILQAPDQLRVDPEMQFLAVGTGCAAYGEILNANNSNLTFAPDILYPRAYEVVQLAIPQYLAGNTISPEEALPVYVRNNVAQVGKKNPD